MMPSRTREREREGAQVVSQVAFRRRRREENLTVGELADEDRKFITRSIFNIGGVL